MINLKGKQKQGWQGGNSHILRTMQITWVRPCRQMIHKAETILENHAHNIIRDFDILTKNPSENNGSNHCKYGFKKKNVCRIVECEGGWDMRGISGPCLEVEKEVECAS